MPDYLLFIYLHRVIPEVFHAPTSCMHSNTAVNLYCYASLFTLYEKKFYNHHC